MIYYVSSVILVTFPHDVQTRIFMTSLNHSIRLIRPKQWIKNLFVFAPLIFSKELFSASYRIEALKAFVGFCLIASSVYIINDILDAEADRAHPEKKNRPIASGAISPKGALGILALLGALGAFTLSGMRPLYLIILGLYFLLNMGYSFKLKEVVLLDVFIIATGFMMRVLAGAFAIDVQLSSWIVLCTMFISLFLGFAKRRAEIVTMQEVGASSERKVLLAYRVDFIDQMLTISAAGTVICYALYTVAPRTLEVFGTDRLIYTTVFVIYGVFRYLFLIHSSRSTENPTNAVTSDPTIIITGLLWIFSCILLIYFGGAIKSVIY